METENKNKHFLTTIVFGILFLIITTVYYLSIINDNVIYHSSVDLFQLYTWTVVILSTTLTVWTYVKNKSHSKRLISAFALALNILTVFYYNKLLKPMPYQFRFSLTNKTKYNLTDLRVIGDKELKLNNIENGKTLNFAFIDYSENSNIDLICKIDNYKTDTLNLASVMTNSCGYFYDIALTIKNGQLSKD